jgi:UDP-N-acetylglucosamine acyltransferase
MTPIVHPTALVDPGAALGAGVQVGPHAIVGPAVTVGEGTTLGPRVILERNVRIGRRCAIGAGAILGGAPQDHKYHGEDTWVEIGDETVIREYSTVNRGTAARRLTRVGAHCFLMTYVHVAHDCILEDHVTVANMVQLAGHVTVEAWATIGGLSPVHQFVRIGTHAFVGGGSRVPQDVPPYTRAAGNPLRLYGINTLGLTRAGIPADVRLALKHAYRLLFNSDLTVTEAVSHLAGDTARFEEVRRLVEFVARTERGVLV